jgi:DNA-binding transcriptional ArsR family regulator
MYLLSEAIVYESEIFKALAHPIRIQILHLLKDGEKCVCEIVPALEMEQPNSFPPPSRLEKGRDTIQP